MKITVAIIAGIPEAKAVGTLNLSLTVKTNFHALLNNIFMKER